MSLSPFFRLFAISLLVSSLAACGGGSGDSEHGGTFPDNPDSGAVRVEVQTFAGSSRYGTNDGKGILASFTAPADVAADENGNVYVVDRNGGYSDNFGIRKITANGEVTTLFRRSAGKPIGGVAVRKGDNEHIYVTGFDAIEEIELSSTNIGWNLRPSAPISLVFPQRLTFSNGSFYVKSLDGDIVAVRANGSGGDVIADSSSVSDPAGITADALGNLYVTGGHLIYKIAPNGDVSTVAGSKTAGLVDGHGTEASFNSPKGITVDANGNLYIADTGNNVIRKITPDRVVTTLAGSGQSGAQNGLGAQASFNLPIAITIDADGHLYVADLENRLIRKITLTKVK